MIERSLERIKETGEVFTPCELVNVVLDQLPEEVWSNASKTWLEPSCGDGNFLVVVLERLMQGLADVISDPVERHRHIIENQLFGVDLMPDNVEACIDRLNARGLKHNIICADGLEYDYSFGRPTELTDGLILESENPEKIKARKEATHKPIELTPPILDSDLFQI